MRGGYGLVDGRYRPEHRWRPWLPATLVASFGCDLRVTGFNLESIVVALLGPVVPTGPKIDASLQPHARSTTFKLPSPTSDVTPGPAGSVSVIGGRLAGPG
jgi:hypothetical protein